MNAILGIVKNGRIEAEAPPDWPEGSPVRVELGVNGQPQLDVERAESSDEIDDWLRWYHSLEPIEMTPEEVAAWKADRRAQAEFDFANSEKRVQGLFD